MGCKLPISRLGNSFFLWFVYLFPVRAYCMPFVLYFFFWQEHHFNPCISSPLHFFPIPKGWHSSLHPLPSETSLLCLVTVNPTLLCPFLLWFTWSSFQYFHTYRGLCLSGRTLDQPWSFFLLPLPPPQQFFQALSPSSPLSPRPCCVQSPDMALLNIGVYICTCRSFEVYSVLWILVMSSSWYYLLYKWEILKRNGQEGEHSDTKPKDKHLSGAVELSKWQVLLGLQ